MSSLSLTEDQLKARDHCGHNIVVSAGAGSGKTFVLGQRVLHFINDEGYKITDFLIVTFTKLAAGEMKERIRKFLTKSGSPEAYRVDEADICTFDSLMLSIVKKYHYLIGVSSKVSMIDSSIIYVKVNDFIREEMEKEYDTLTGNKEFQAGIAKFCVKDDRDIIRVLFEMYKYFSLQTDFEKAVNSYIDNCYSDMALGNLFDEYVNEILKIRDILKGEYSKLPDVFYKAGNAPINDYLYSMQKAFLESEPNYTDLRNNFNPNCMLSRKPSGKEYDIEFKVTYDFIKEKNNEIKYLLEYLPATKEEFIAKSKVDIPFIKSLLDIVLRVYKRIALFKNLKQSYEFQDITNMALKIFENDEVRIEMSKKYKMIMIDEYQDTSDVQEKFVNLIGNNNVYMVGDIKQSIYRFRNAKPQLFDEKFNSYQDPNNPNEAINLKDNFRSRKEVLEDINFLFSNLMRKDNGGINYLKDHVINIGNKDFDKAGSNGQNCHSSVFVYNGDKKKKQSISEATIIVKDIIEKMNNHYQVMDNETKLLRDCRLSDFCILIDRTTSFEDFSQVFMDNHIPLFVEQDERISKNTFLLLIRNLLYVVNCIKKDDGFEDVAFKHAYASLSRSFIFNSTDNDIYYAFKDNHLKFNHPFVSLRNLLTQYKDEPINDLIRNIIFDLGVYEKLPTFGNIIANERYIDEILNKLDDMANLDYSINNMIDYLDKIDEYDVKVTLPSTSPSFDSVRMMDIHKSKGLEFNIIYYPMLTTNFNNPESKTRFGVSERGVFLPMDDDDNYIATRVKEKNKFDDICEKIRLWYVALTRAKEKMIFIIPNEKLDKDNIFFFPYSVPTTENIKNMGDMLIKFLCEDAFFTIETKEISEPTTFLNSGIKKVEQEKFNVQSLILISERTSTKKASKEIQSDVNYDILEYGTKLHLAMEVMDFKNPNYEIFGNDHNIISKVQRFINSPLLKDINNKPCEIYHEFNFNDEENNTNGIIDLFIKYEDHIDIIDYKTSNIDSPEYDKQLHVYANYLKEISSLPINMYLYSLSKGEYREVK